MPGFRVVCVFRGSIPGFFDQGSALAAGFLICVICVIRG